MRGTFRLLQFSMNFLLKATIPKNDCKLVLLVGESNKFGCYLFRVGLDNFTTDYVSQEGQALMIELALIELGKQLVFSKG